MAITSEMSVHLRRLFSNVWRNSTPCVLNLNIKRNHHCEAGHNENYNDNDVTIVGGGMVGTALAVALAKNRSFETRKIVLLEGSGKRKFEKSEKYSNRVVALNKQTRMLLSSIGAWKHIEDVRVTAVRKMQIWDAISDAMTTFNEDHLSDDIAYIVENDVLLHALAQELEDKPNLHVIYNAKVEEISLPRQRGETSKIKLHNGNELSSKLLVGADGANSRVREAMGTQYVSWNYEQMGVVATLKLSEATENYVAWQRFLPTGPIALLPLSEDQSSLVWSLPTDEARRVLNIPEEEFVDAINDALWKIYPKNSMVEGGMSALQQVLAGLSLQTGVSRQLQPSISGIIEGSRAAFPLGFGHAANYVANGVALVGDAAHRVHPLAGQGVNLGFGDVTALIKVLNEATKNGTLIGDVLHLTEYESVRQKHNVPTMLAIDALNKLYRGTAVPVVLVRSLGLQLFHALTPLKRCVMDHVSEVPVGR